MIKMIGWIEGVISGTGYSEYLAFYIKDGKLIVDPFIYGDTLRRVEMNELLKNITVSNNKCTVDFSNYESFHYFISAQCFKSETDICNTKWYGNPVSEEAFNKYLAEQTNENSKQITNKSNKMIPNMYKNNDVFKELFNNVTKDLYIPDVSSKSIFEELMKQLSNTDEAVSLLSNNENIESDKKETNDHFKGRLFGWISFDNLRTAIFINKDESQFDTISFDVTTEEIVENPFKIDFINNTICFNEKKHLRFNQLIIDSNNIKNDIIDFEDRDINCEVSKEEFLKNNGLKEIDFSYDDLIELLQKKQINPLDIATHYQLV